MKNPYKALIKPAVPILTWLFRPFYWLMLDTVDDRQYGTQASPIIIYIHKDVTLEGNEDAPFLVGEYYYKIDTSTRYDSVGTYLQAKTKLYISPTLFFTYSDPKYRLHDQYEEEIELFYSTDLKIKGNLQTADQRKLNIFASNLIQQCKRRNYSVEVHGPAKNQAKVAAKRLIGYGAYAILGLGLSTTTISISLLYLSKQEAFTWGELQPEAATSIIAIASIVFFALIAAIADKLIWDKEARNLPLYKTKQPDTKSLISALIFRTAVPLALAGTAMMATELSIDLDPELSQYVTFGIIAGTVLLTILTTLVEYMYKSGGCSGKSP